MSSITVKPGDTLSALAVRHKTTVEALVELNGLKDPDHLQVGQSLQMSADTAEISQEAAEAAASRPATETVTVKAGDTLDAIARRHDTTVDALQRLNGIRNPDRLSIGQELRLTGGPTAPVPLPRPRPDDATRPASSEVPLHLAPMNETDLSPREVESLIRAVAAEARGESPEVWTAVAQTIINYAERNEKNLARLVRTSYLSSNFDDNRRYYTMPLARIPNVTAIRDAVLAAARGESPIGDRIHFHDDSIRTPRYGDRSTRLTIGNMIFYNPK